MNKRSMKIAAVLALLLCLLLGAVSARADTVSTNIRVQLTLTGDTPPSASSFTFVLKPDKATNPMPAASTITIAGAGSDSFGPMSYTEPNDYKYTIYQVAGNVTGYTYDSRVYTVTVQVTSDNQGRLTATVYLDGGGGYKPIHALFTNKFAVKTKIPKTGDPFGPITQHGWLAALLCCVTLASVQYVKRAPSQK